ncbi:glycosyltransferase [Rathayibacter sp. YIM 133350]|uniref:glycosyltransferase n=1 Tax=Rathayibacter sp. YIM 133350 TaxID=3131992 RepID=UPI00307F72F8
MTLKSMQVYVEARTAHLERGSVKSADHLFVYNGESYDFDLDLAARTGAVRAGTVATATMILRRRPDVLELNEPAMAGAWVKLFVYTAAAKLASIGRSKIAIVTYAIENADLRAAFSHKTHLPRGISDAVTAFIVRLLCRGFTRIAFGTQGARANYEDLVGRRNLNRSETADFRALEPACDCSGDDKVDERVVFLGAFEERKGLLRVMEAWPSVQKARPQARLTIAGKGPLENRVKEWVSANDGVDLVVDPAREKIHEILRSSAVLVLFSQRTGTWREQVGLPIVEGLSHGCTIVASAETGLSDWLIAHGHGVLEASANTGELARVIEEKVKAPIDRGEVLRSLPESSQRLEAGRWMYGRTVVV